MPEPDPRTQTPLSPALRWSRALGVLVLGLAMLLLLGFPWTLGALVLGPVTTIVGIVVLVAKGSADLGTWARANAVIGVVLGAFSGMSAVGMLILFEPLTELDSCRARAITTSAEDACQADFDQAYEDLLSRYGVELPTTG